MLLCCFWRHVSWDLLGLSRNEDLSGTWRLDSQFDSKVWGSSAFSNTSETGDSVLGDMSGWSETSWVSTEGWLEWSGADSVGSVQQAQRWSLYHLATSKSNMDTQYACLKKVVPSKYYGYFGGFYVEFQGCKLTLFFLFLPCALLNDNWCPDVHEPAVRLTCIHQKLHTRRSLQMSELPRFNRCVQGGRVFRYLAETKNKFPPKKKDLVSIGPHTTRILSKLRRRHQSSYCQP